MRNKKGQFKKGSKPTHGFKKGVKVWNKDKKGIHLSPESEFKKGMTPWNKGVPMAEKEKVNLAFKLKGRRLSPKTEWRKGDTAGDKNAKWKGDEVGYFGLHTWAQRTLGKAKRCRNRVKQILPFKCSRKSIFYDWANRSRDYKREKTDWIELCHSCHLTADRRKIEL